MAVLRILTSALALLALGAWIYVYIWISAMACAFGSPNGNCGLPMPWQLDGESLVYMVILPGVGTAFLFGLAWALWRAGD